MNNKDNNLVTKLKEAIIKIQEIECYCVSRFSRAKETSEKGIWQMRIADCMEIHKTLGQAQKALQWKPYPENRPEEGRRYLICVRCSEEYYRQAIAWYIHGWPSQYDFGVVAWKELSPDYNLEQLDNDSNDTQQKNPDGTYSPAIALPYPETWIERIRRFFGLPTWNNPKRK